VNVTRTFDENPMNKLKNKSFSHISPKDWQDWRWQFKNRITGPEAAGIFFNTAAADQELLKQTAAVYPLAITPYYFSLINRDDQNDPIKKQCFLIPGKYSLMKIRMILWRKTLICPRPSWCIAIPTAAWPW